ncbi:MAG: hypothetical protein WC787_01800 [Patescibacteria group bacterium]
MPKEPKTYSFAGAVVALKKRLDQLPPKLARDIRGEIHELPICMLIESAAGDCFGLSVDTIPSWFRELPSPYRRLASRAWATHIIEDPNIVSSFPFTGFGGYTADLDSEGLMGSAYRNFNLARLGHVRQLGWLTVPVFGNEQEHVIPMRFEHNRLSHVLDVAALANVFAHGLDLSDADTATLVLAAATHDARTPAGGDTTKMLDPAFFDEDAHYSELLDRFDSTALFERFGINRETLTQTILGKGLLGSLLDIADKIAYVSRDAFWYHQRLGRGFIESEEGDQIHSLLRTYPEDACATWQSLKIVDGQPVFDDPEPLARFLLLRALLFRALYWHPAARFTEFIVSHVICRHLVATGKIRLADLLEMRDEELDRHVMPYRALDFSSGFGTPHHEGFDDEASSERRREELHAQGERFVMIEKWPHRLKTGTHYLVKDGRRKPRPLASFAPDLVEPIEAVAQVVHPHRLYWVQEETIPQRLKRIILP